MLNYIRNSIISKQNEYVIYIHVFYVHDNVQTGTSGNLDFELFSNLDEATNNLAGLVYTKIRNFKTTELITYNINWPSERNYNFLVVAIAIALHAKQRLSTVHSTMNGF